MVYLLGQSKDSRNIYTGELPDGCNLEPPENRIWEIEISKREFDKLPKEAQMNVIMMGDIVHIFKIKD